MGDMSKTLPVPPPTPLFGVPGAKTLRPSTSFPPTLLSAKGVRPMSVSAPSSVIEMPTKKKPLSKVKKETSQNKSQHVGAGEGLHHYQQECRADKLQATVKPIVMNEEVFKELLEWLDKIPFTRPRKNLHRDFSDGVMMAELVAHFFPKMIELHNYVGANGWTLKKKNWDLLNRKILPKLGIKLQDPAIESICLAKPGFIEPVLGQVRKLLHKKSEEEKLARAQELARNNGDSAEQNLVETNCLIHVVTNSPPDYIVYKGRKYCPESMIEAQQKINMELKEKIKEFTAKTRRLETMVNLKETHLEDLTRQLHEQRLKLGDVQHDCVCKWKDGDKPPIRNSFN